MNLSNKLGYDLLTILTFHLKNTFENRYYFSKSVNKLRHLKVIITYVISVHKIVII